MDILENNIYADILVGSAMYCMQSLNNTGSTGSSSLQQTCCPSLPHRTKGDLRKSSLKYDLRKYYFTNRVCDIWNSLPNWVVTAKDVNTFKSRLDSYWHNQ